MTRWDKKDPKKGFTVKDIQTAEFNLEPTRCRNCGSLNAGYHQYIGSVKCPVCGFWDDGGQIKRQLKEQKITDMRKMMSLSQRDKRLGKVL